MLSVTEFIDSVKDELGDSEQLVRDEHLIRWVGRGVARLGLFEAKSAAITWSAGAASVDLPSDFERLDRIVPDHSSRLPEHVVLGTKLAFLDPQCVGDGSATVYYGARYAAPVGDNVSTMPALADEAVISYVLARFFRRVAATRADFQRYVTVTGQSGVEVQDLLDMAARHDADFLAAREELQAGAATTYYSD